ncbi:MAG TPA: MerR family transcriptional regulator [Edaphobacter sp.]|nr:MerR family transcriptional regulator [Edaphobacter sp.]
MSQHQTIRSKAASSGAEIPDKLYFRIGEVARLCDVPAYVLRFWESEFPQLKPHKGGTGQRLYRRRDVEAVLHIKSLLYDEGYTISGARQAIKTEQKQKAPQLALDIEVARPADSAQHLRKLKKEMRELLAHLSRPAVRPTVQSIRPPRVSSSSTRRVSSDELFHLETDL